MKKSIPIIFLLSAYCALIFPLAHQLKSRPVIVKLGFMPEAEGLRAVASDQRYFLAEFSVVKILFYFGSVIDQIANKNRITPEFFHMYKMLETAVKLDPYNEDAYYFAQGNFVWELNRSRDVNRMLMYGMKYRTWDYMLPFYIGFNYAYFQKDYKTASTYMQKAAELSGDVLFTNLTARYFYEAGRSDLGILFLRTMERDAKNIKIKKIFGIRKSALEGVEILSEAKVRYEKRFKTKLRDINDLVVKGVISHIPQDPYGGRFYLDDNGRIRSTSKFAFGSTVSHDRD